jgi:hypothetical protein
MEILPWNKDHLNVKNADLLQGIPLYQVYGTVKNVDTE